MTTTVIVRANHGWPVKVTTQSYTTTAVLTREHIVDPDTEQTFYVYDGLDILIHEVQPNEIKVP